MIVGLLIGLAFGAIGVGLSYPEYGSSKEKEKHIRIGVLVIIICLTLGAIVGGTIVHETNKQFILSYIVSKETIENSIKSTDISGLERIELVKQTLELNNSLTQKQYVSQRWYGVGIPDEIMELKPILLGVD